METLSLLLLLILGLVVAGGVWITLCNLRRRRTRAQVVEIAPAVLPTELPSSALFDPVIVVE